MALGTLPSAGAASRGVRIAVQIPFTVADLPALERAHAVWSRMEPCYNSADALSAGLLYVHNRRCDKSASSPCARVKKIADATMVTRRCFGRRDVLAAGLNAKSDRYDKKRRHSSWTEGPNKLFLFSVAQAQLLGYSHMMQLEADVLPVRPGWLGRVQSLARLSDAWVIGSALYANCTREETTGECVQNLPEDIAEHINGNAIYAIGDAAFQTYLQASSRGKVGRMPFDLALHTLRQRFDQPTRRQLLSRFHHSSFILNMGTALPDVNFLRVHQPGTFLVHSSAFSRLNSTTLSALFFGSEHVLFDQAISAASHQAKPLNADSASPGLDLTALVDQAGSGRTVVAAFVAGEIYHEMCRNYAFHVRQAGLRHHILIALDSATTRWLREEERAPILDASGLVKLPEGGSDQFGSAAFFAINGARYRVLQAVLEVGISMFVLDLDVVLLRDPLDWLAHEGASVAAGRDLLLQSDARDGVSQLEYDPDLVERRLGLVGQANWTYVNGGVFFCRASPGSAALFRKVWNTLSGAETAPNEQDLLNKELAGGSTVRWGVLPAVDFPNGFVYFTRPVPSLAKPVLLHANWIGGVDEKVYHLREAGLWALGAAVPLNARRLLSIGDWIDRGPEGPLGIAAHRRSLRDALAIADALNRTLILPRLPVSLGGPSRRNSTTIAHFFDYGALHRQFPNVCARDQDARRFADTTLVHIDVGRGDDPPVGGGFTVVRARTRVGLTDKSIRRRLAPFADTRVLHLSTAYRRSSLARASGEQSRLDVGMYRGILPAARLRNLARFIRHTMRKAHRRFDCVDASSSSEFATVLAGPPNVHRNDTESNRLAATPPLSQDFIRAAARRLRNPRRQVLILGSSARTPGLYDEASRLFSGRLINIEDIMPAWYRVDYDTPETVETLAREYVEVSVCAQAERFVGNLAAPSTHAVCALSGRGVRNYAGRDVERCEDALGREIQLSKWHFF